MKNFNFWYYLALGIAIFWLIIGLKANATECQQQYCEYNNNWLDNRILTNTTQNNNSKPIMLLNAKSSSGFIQFYNFNTQKVENVQEISKGIYYTY